MGKHLAFGGVSTAVAVIALGVTGCSVSVKSDPISPSSTVTSSPLRHPAPSVTVTTTVTKTVTASPTHSMTVNPPRFPLANAIVYYLDTGGDTRTAGSFDTSCGASLIPTLVPNTYRNSVKSAMMSLVSHGTATVGGSGLRNPLYESTLQYQKSETNGSTVSVWLTGTLRSPGTCADQQIIDQLEHTAIASADAKQAQVYVNGKLVRDVLSTKG